MISIKFPIFLTIRYARHIIERCQEGTQSKSKKIEFDFSNCGFGDPFGISLTVGTMMSCIANGKEVFFKRPRKAVFDKYLNDIGFYEWGAGTGGKGKFSHHRAELRHFRQLDPAYVSSVIGVLNGMINLTKPVQDSIQMSLNELMTNAFDHSQTLEGCFICAQAFNTRGNVSICITDFGRGILNALKSVDRYQQLETSVDAIKLAIKEGVSSRVGVRGGLGLPHIHRFLNNNEGEIHIISGNGWVHWKYSNENDPKITERTLEIPYFGTIVNIIARADAEGINFISTGDVEENIF